MDPVSSDAVRERLGSLRAAWCALVLVTHDELEALALASHAHEMVRGAWARSGPRCESIEGFLEEYREVARG
jgi:ABC-type proline/glycine betaine transport system ATPase subunit